MRKKRPFDRHSIIKRKKKEKKQRFSSHGGREGKRYVEKKRELGTAVE